ncbi:tetratricopeptide repeat protein [candidate division KSB1 bacterium]|nr:tetratricopeptide repeat protein [candidate division KSB1 bacterium]
MKRLIFVVMFIIFTFTIAFTQNFQLKKISDKVFIVIDPAGGENQVVIKSEKGLVVLNTFWSQITARKFKNEIARASNRNDFAYTLNLVDRLDMFGGNATYKETIIIGHDSFMEKYKGKEKEVDAEIQRLIEMWRWKEDLSRKRLETQEKGSEKAKTEEQWMNTCKQRADELKDSYSLVLPTVYYNDQMALGLGDVTLKLIWFGKAGHYNGMTLVVIPEEKVAIIPGFIMHSQHLAPYPYNEYAELDVPRWISVLEEILEGENAVEQVICGMDDLWTRERAHTHLEYIRKLWNNIKIAEADGKTLSQVQDQLSLEKDFAFVKDMQVYKDRGDEWIRPQHQSHVSVFFLQDKNLASEIIKKEGIASLPRLRKLQEEGSDLYFDETSINAIGYFLMSSGKIAEAVEIFRFNVELFPESANVYDSLGEAYMKSGDKKNAIKNYQKSLELNPNNDNAKKMIEEIKKK